MTAAHQACAGTRSARGGNPAPLAASRTTVQPFVASAPGRNELFQIDRPEVVRDARDADRRGASGAGAWGRSSRASISSSSRIGELEAVGSEELDAVVFDRVVREAEIITAGGGRDADGDGGDRTASARSPRLDDVASGRRDARRSIAASSIVPDTARVIAPDDDRPGGRMSACDDHRRAGASDRERQLRREVGVGDAAYRRRSRTDGRVISRRRNSSTA